MAYGLRIRFEFKDDQDRYYAANLFQRDFTGAADVRELTGTPVVIEYGDSSSDDLPTVLGSMATLNFYAETGDDWGELYTADRRMFRLDIRQDNATTGQLYWTGWLMTEEYSETLTWEPSMSIKAYCGLGELKELDYKDASGYDYTGRKSYLTILADLLAKLNLSLNIHTAIDWRDTNMAVGDSFAQTFVDVEVYSTKSCREVLEQLLIGCRIMQRLGEWYVESYTALKRGNHTLYHYDYTGVALSTASETVSLKSGINQVDVWTEGKPMLERWPAHQKLQMKQNLAKRESYFLNHQFKKGLGNWTNETGFDYPFFPPAGSSESYIRLSGFLSGGIRQSIEINKPDGVFIFGVRMSAIGGQMLNSSGWVMNDFTFNHVIELKLVTPTQTYYLNDNNAWQTSACTLTVSGLRSERYANPANSTGYNFNWVDFEKTLTFPDTMVSGTLSVYLPVVAPFYINGGPSTYRTDICYTDIVAFEKGDVPSENAITGINHGSYINVKDGVSLLQGSLPVNANAPLVWAGGLSYTVSQYMQAKLWYLEGYATTYGYAELINLVLLSLRLSPLSTMQCNLVGGSVEKVYEELNQPGVDYVFAGGAYDIKTRTGDGKWVQLLAFAPLLIDIVTGETSGSGTSQVTNGGGTYPSYIINQGIENNYRLKYNPDLNRLEVSVSLHVFGNITASEEIAAWVAAAVASEVLAGLTAQAPLKKVSSSIVGLDYDVETLSVVDGKLTVIAGSGSGTGTVTSVALALPAELSISGSPVTVSGTLTAAWAAQVINKIFASPASGASGTPGFRTLVAADIPSLDWGKITTGVPGFLTAITSLMVTNALGFTPYNSSNPSGYLTAITKAMIEAQLTGAITSHTHAAYLNAITKAMVEAVLIGDISSHTHSSYLTAITKAMIEAQLTGAITSHTHAAYLTAITKAMVEAVLIGDISSHTHSSYLTAITKAMIEAQLTGEITSHTHAAKDVIQTLTYAATTLFDYTSGNAAKLTLAGNTILSLSNIPDGGRGIIQTLQDTTGGWLISSITHTGLTIIRKGQGNLTPSANAKDLIRYNRVGTLLFFEIVPQTITLYNDSGVQKWSIQLGTSDVLELRNASGTLEAVIDQSGNMKAKGEVTAYATI